MVAFDLLYLNGYDLRKLPLFERKALLHTIIVETDTQVLTCHHCTSVLRRTCSGQRLGRASVLL
jgi:ATP-dependent DNA ligase